MATKKSKNVPQTDVTAAPVEAVGGQNAFSEQPTMVAGSGNALMTAEQFDTLGEVIGSMDGSDSGYLMINLATVPGLIAANYIVSNPSIVDGVLTATMATQAGIDYWQANKTPVDTAAAQVQDAAIATTTTKASKMNFEIVSDFTPPATAKKRGGKQDVYPFAQLAIGQSFFVPATEAKPEPWKSLVSTVAQAMGRYALDTGKTKVTGKGNTIAIKRRTRQFGLYQSERNGVPGAMILRQPDATNGAVDDSGDE